MLKELIKRWLGIKDPAPFRPAVYVAGSLSGPPLEPQEIAEALANHHGHIAVRSVLQVLESHAAWWQRTGQSEDMAARGMTTYYTSGAAALADALDTIQALASGQQAAQKKRLV